MQATKRAARLCGEAGDEIRERGFTVLRSVLPPQQIDQLLAESKSVFERAEPSHFVDGLYKDPDSRTLTRILEQSRAFDALIDHCTFLPTLVELLGPYFQLLGTELLRRGRSERPITAIHTDMGRGLQSLTPSCDGTYLALKIQLFLTSTTADDTGGMVLIPRTHRRVVDQSRGYTDIDRLNDDIARAGSYPTEVAQLRLEAGDAVVFPHTIWHGTAPNRTDNTRYSFVLRYGATALRPVDPHDHVLAEAGRFTARQRRIVGDLGEGSHFRPERIRGLTR